MARHLSLEELNNNLDRILESPKDQGDLKMIVTRPVKNERKVHESIMLSAEKGVHGDNWSHDCWMTLPDGRSDPEVQVSIMNARCIDIIAQEKDRWKLAGDNFFIDMDLSRENLAPGQRLSLGSCIMEVSAEPHKGCLKFAERFGPDATRFVNGKVGRNLRLRGIYAKVIQAGTVSLGDKCSKQDS